MHTLTIESRDYGPVQFKGRPGGYLWVRIGDAAEYRQPCLGGGFGGVTAHVPTDRAAFERLCRSWWRMQREYLGMFGLEDE